MKRILRKLYFSSEIVRRLIGFASVITGRTSPLGVAHLLSYDDDKAIGPLQQPEALVLLSIVRTVVPMTIVEFGFYRGQSAFNFLQAMPPNSKLFSYDISNESSILAKSDLSHDPRFHFIHKSQTDFCKSDIQDRTIDIVLLDAAHDFELNRKTFESILPSLTRDSIICIHDTGLWKKEFFLDTHHSFVRKQGEEYWIDETHYAHQNDERVFVNWILETYPAFQAIHLHSSNSLRHGLSILQQKGKLETA